MTDLLQNLSKELEIHFDCKESPEQIESNLSVLAEQLQLLITAINQNRFLRDVLRPDIGIAEKIKRVECLTREATQLYRNSQADALTNLSLDKEIRRRRRVLRKIKRSSGSTVSERSWTPPNCGPVTLRRIQLSPIRESIPLPPPSPSVRFRFNLDNNSNNTSSGSSRSHNSSFSSLDTDEPLEFDLV